MNNYELSLLNMNKLFRICKLKKINPNRVKSIMKKLIRNLL